MTPSLGFHKQFGQALSKPVVFRVPATMHALRRYKLRTLINSRFHGDRGEFLKASGLSKGRLTQLLDPAKPFGDNAAKNLADRLGLPEGYFDTLDERTQRFALAFEDLPDAVKDRWESLVSLMAEEPKR